MGAAVVVLGADEVVVCAGDGGGVIVVVSGSFSTSHERWSCGCGGFGARTRASRGGAADRAA